MRDAIKECYLVTEELYSLSGEKEPTDEQVKKIESLLNRREELLKQVIPPFSEEEQKLGRQLVAWNNVINVKLAAIKQNISYKIKELKRTKKALPKYNAYGATVGADAYFYDKKN